MNTMPRVSKDPQVRMEEILDAAENLFYTRGYHETAVSDIVKKVGVAQGTFYYYFESKEAALEGVINRHVLSIQSRIEAIANSDIIPPRKIEQVVCTTFNNLRYGEGWMFDFLYNDQYLHIVDKLLRHGREMFAPSLIKIIEEGNQTGYFKVSYPTEMMVFVSAILQCLYHSLYQKLSKEQLVCRFDIAGKLIENALGLAEGTLHLMV